MSSGGGSSAAIRGHPADLSNRAIIARSVRSTDSDRSPVFLHELGRRFPARASARVVQRASGSCARHKYLSASRKLPSSVTKEPLQTRACTTHRTTVWFAIRGSSNHGVAHKTAHHTRVKEGGQSRRRRQRVCTMCTSILCTRQERQSRASSSRLDAGRISRGHHMMQPSGLRW